MSNKKQISVEWLLDQLLNKKGMVIISTSTFYFNEEIVNQAKKMEKQRIIEAYKIAFSIDKNYVSDEIAQLSAENYYRQTYEATHE